MQAIVLAGGQGTRLKPFTNAIPKPLVPIGDMPILEVILKQLRRAGVRNVVLAVNHLARLIQAFFGDGSDYDMSIQYSLEDKPLGTAGPLRLIKNLDEHFLLMNGDLLTTLDYSDLMAYHRKSGHLLTIATYQRTVKIDLGVLAIQNGLLEDYTEKPEYHFDVSMGIYACSKAIVDHIPANQRYDVPQLAMDLKANGYPVGCYSGSYEWLDIGRIDDYETAVELFEANRTAYLGE